MVSSEKSNSDLSEYNLFQIQKIFYIYKNQFLDEKLTFLGFFLDCFLNTSKVQ